MKKKIFSVIAVIMVFTIFLSGCSSEVKLSGGPASSDPVTSNGGLSVQKGNYLYFVNGYVNSDNLVSGDNKYGDVKNAGIYRAELNSQNELLKDEEGNLLNVELLVPKVVGFENGGIYIFDNYIFYASPTILKDKTGTVRFDLVDFYVAKLDGSNVEKVYATDDYTSSSTYSFYKMNGAVYLVVYDGSKVVSVKIKSGKASDPVTMVKDATSVAFPEVTSYSQDSQDVDVVNQYIYYTRELDSDKDDTILEIGNVLSKVKIGTSTEIKLVQDNEWTYSLNYVLNDGLYYTKSGENSLSSKFYYTSLEDSIFNTDNELQLTGTYYSKVLPYKNLGVVALSDDKLVYVSDVFSSTGIKVLVSEEVTPLFVIGDYVYYTSGDNNTLSRVNVNTEEIEVLTDEEDEFIVDMNVNADYDNEYIYLYKKYSNDNGDSYYLERIKYMTTSFESEFIGDMEKAHIPTDENEESEETTEQ